MSNEGQDRSAEVEGDPTLDRFAQSLRGQVPRLPDAAMRRVELSFQAELNRHYPPAPIPLSGWTHWVATAAMLLLAVGLALHVSRDTSQSLPTEIAARPRVNDVFEVVIQPDRRGPSGGDVPSAWDLLLQPIDRYASLFGLDRLSRR